MVNLSSGPFSVVHEPDDSVSAYGFPACFDNDIPIIVDVPCNCIGDSTFPRQGLTPPKYAVVIPEYEVHIVRIYRLCFCMCVSLLFGGYRQIFDTVV